MRSRAEAYGYGLIMLFISPMISLYYTLRSSDKTYTKWMLTFFSTIYASTFNRTTVGDGVRHWSRVYEYYVDLPFQQFVRDIWNILLFNSSPETQEDIYIHVLSYFVGEVLSLPGLFFVFVGFIYGYFFSSSMVRVFDTFPSIRKHFPFFIIAVFFIVILNLNSMNTVRTWTGFWVLFYGVISYYQTGNKRYLLYLFLPPFIHIGFFVMAIPVWLVVFLPIPKIPLVILFAISFSTTLIGPERSLSQLEKSEVGQEKVQAYYTEETKSTLEKYQEVNESSRWYRSYKRAGIASMAVVLISIVFIWNNTYFSDMKRIEAKLFSIGLLSKILSNSTWYLFALNNRSEAISNLFILAAVLLWWQRKYFEKKSITWPAGSQFVLYLATIFILPHFIYTLSNTIEYLSMYIFVLPEMAWLGEDVKITVRQVLGKVLGID